VRSLRLHSRGGEAVFQSLAHDERQERAEHVAADDFVRLVIDRPGVESGFGCPEGALAQRLASELRISYFMKW